MIDLQLPTWMVKELSNYSDKSTQYIIKNLIKETLNTEEGREILEKLRKREGI